MQGGVRFRSMNPQNASKKEKLEERARTPLQTTSETKIDYRVCRGPAADGEDARSKRAVRGAVALYFSLASTQQTTPHCSKPTAIVGAHHGLQRPRVAPTP